MLKEWNSWENITTNVYVSTISKVFTIARDAAAVPLVNTPLISSLQLNRWMRLYSKNCRCNSYGVRC